jgi:hypothetical protein
MTRIEEEALARLKRRVARMSRLLQLEAPLPILALEAELIGEAGMMLNPRTHFDREHDTYLRQIKRGLGLCTEEGCEEAVAWRASRDSGGPAGPFHAECCLTHAKEHEEDVADDGDDDESVC